MRRRIMVVVGIVTVALLAVVAAVPVAAHMGVGRDGSPASESANTTISMAEAKTNFTQYVRQQGYEDLTISEVMQFSNQFYAEAKDAKTNSGAFELVMSLDGQVVTPEPGPTMMWNTENSPMIGDRGAGLRQGMPVSAMAGSYDSMGSDGYARGMMGDANNEYSRGMTGGGRHGMMDDSSETPVSSLDPASCFGDNAEGYHPDTATQLDQPLTADAAQTRVQSWLDQNRPGATATDVTAFPGYFTFHTEQNGKIIGMLSIQSSTGAIWEHVWHGTFVAMEPGS